MRLLLIAILVSTKGYGCIPCDEEASAYLERRAYMKLPTKIFSDTGKGFVEFEITLNPTARKRSFLIQNKSPESIPDSYLKEMISKSAWGYNLKESHIFCEDIVLTHRFEFEVPKKPEFKVEVEVELLEIEINHVKQ